MLGTNYFRDIIRRRRRQQLRATVNNSFGCVVYVLQSTIYRKDGRYVHCVHIVDSKDLMPFFMGCIELI